MLVSLKKLHREISFKKEDFLSHAENKAAMIDLIIIALTVRGCYDILSQGDGNVDIVNATVECSRICICLARIHIR